MALRRPTSSVLAPYLPRLAVEWAEQAPAAQQTWRALDGSLVFVDISGFTALSERLARRGRLGAEELTGLLGTCFGELLAVAYAAGGSLLKFGGDALLLLFDGDDHPMRAATSAIHMRTTMGWVGQMATSVGSVRLRMSVGVHSGTLHVFRVGCSHHELMLTGPGVSTVVAMESTAEAGEIVVSPSTAQALDARLIGAPKGPGYLLRGKGGAFDRGSFPPAPVPRIDLSESVPTALRSHLLAGTVESEHRNVTVGFVHFDDVDHLLTSAGPETVAGALEELVCDTQAAVEDQDVTFLGTDIDRDGGKIILVAGAPAALEDDEGRMLRAVRRIADGTRRLPVRIGVNRGPVFAGEVGPHYRRTYTVMGDAVNLAARVMAKATPGQILATQGVLDLSRTTFETEALPPFMVKGKSAPVAAYALGAPTGRRRGAVRASHELPLCGRAAELATLLAAFAEAREGRGRSVEIVGEPGIGKSRLLEELRRRSDAMTVCAFCEPYHTKTPYFAFRFLLRGLLGIVRTDRTEGGKALRKRVRDSAPALAPWLPLLADVIDVDSEPTDEVAELEPRFRPERTRWAVVELLRVLATTPTLLIIEDAQWMDEASAELFNAVAASAGDHPWLLCQARSDASTRPSRSAGDATRVIRLGPLDASDARALLSSASGETLLRPHERDALVRQSGGNPLFLEELARAQSTADASAPLPESLEAVVATEIDRLPPADRRLLRYAAVLGTTFEPGLLAEIVDKDLRSTATSAGRRLGGYLEIAGAGGLLRFRNQCYRDVAYGALSFGRRRELHSRAADAIERNGADEATARAEVLSLHFLHAQRYEPCWHYARVAAERAREKYANVEAAELLERALVAGRHLDSLTDEEVAETWEALGDVALDAAIFDRANEAFTHARRLRRHDNLAQARLCNKHASTAAHLGQSTGEVRWIHRGLRLLAGDNPDELAARADLHMHYAQNRQRAARHREAVRWCRSAIEDAQASGNLRALANAYATLDWAYTDLGKPELATNAMRALEIFEQLGLLGSQAAVLSYLAGIAYFQSRWDEAAELNVRGRDACLRAGSVSNAAVCTHNRAVIWLDQGRVAEAEVGVSEALEVWRSVSDRYRIAAALLSTARIALWHGDYGKAIDLLELSKADVADAGDGACLEADMWIGECLARKGDIEAALVAVNAALVRAGGNAGTTFLPQLHRLRGCLYASVTRFEDAACELETSLATARARNSLYEVALTLEAMAEVRRRTGEPRDDAAEVERKELLDTLGVMATLPPPLVGLGPPAQTIAS